MVLGEQIKKNKRMNSLHTAKNAQYKTFLLLHYFCRKIRNHLFSYNIINTIQFDTLSYSHQV